MAQRIIGLDIGSWSVKAMVMESSLRRVDFVGLQQARVPLDTTGRPLDDGMTTAIAAATRGPDADAVVTAIPGVQVLMRKLELPFSDEKRVTPVLGFQLESALPRPLDSVIYDWHVLHKHADGATLLCPAVDKAWLQRWLGEVRASGVQPRQLTVGALAVENLAAHLDFGEVGADQTVAIVDLGHRATHVSLLVGGRLIDLRTLARGGHQLTAELSRTLGIDYSAAEEVKHHKVDLTGALPAGLTAEQHRLHLQVVSRALEPLIRELKMTLDAAVPAETPLGAVVVVGGTSKLPGLDRVLERALGAPVQTPTLKGAIWESIAGAADVTSDGLTAAGLALEHVAPGEHRVNLGRWDGAANSDFGAIRAKAGWIATFLAIALALFVTRKIMRISTLEEQEAELAARLAEHASEVLNEPVDPELDVPVRFEQVLGMVQNPPGSDAGEVYPTMTAFKIFYEVTKIQDALNDAAVAQAGEAGAHGDEEEPLHEEEPPPDAAPSATPAVVPAAERKQIELTSFAADVKTAATAGATVSGSGYDIVTIEDFAGRLKQHPCFKKVDRQETHKSNDPARPGWTDFTIKLEARCGDPAVAKTAGSDTAAPKETP